MGRHPEFLFPATKPFMFDVHPINFTELLLSVMVDEQRDGKHVAVGGLMSKLLAGHVLDTGFEWPTTLIGPVIPALGGTSQRAVLTVAIPIAKPGGVAMITMQGTVILALNAIHLGAVALYNAEQGFARVVPLIPRVFRHSNTIKPWSVDVPDTIFSVVVNKHHNFIKSKLIREMPMVIWMPIGVNAHLDRGDDVGVFQGHDGA
jgi:hypothetical protein